MPIRGKVVDGDVARPHSRGRAMGLVTQLTHRALKGIVGKRLTYRPPANN
jgi:hypothetical protein